MPRSAFLILAACLAGPATAQQFFGDTSIKGHLCVGQDCSVSESFANTKTMKLKGPDLEIRFEDSSVDLGYPTADWSIVSNENALLGDNYLAVRDISANTLPFKIRDNAPSHALVVGTITGDIGLGTLLPLRSLHAVRPDTAAIRLERTNSPAQSWDILGNVSLQIVDATSSTIPVIVFPGAPHWSLAIDPAGQVGMGTAVPQSALHVRGEDGDTRLLLEEASLTANPRTLLNLTNNGRPEIVMANTATNGEWSFGAGTDFFLKVGTVGSASGAKTKVFTVKGNGDAIVAGTLTTGGTTCGGGCDRVFTDHAIIPAPDYAAQMWSQGHLPHVGPTVEGAPINVSEKLGGTLNALEYAHVFIAALRDENETLRAEKSAMEIRLSRVEAELAELARHIRD